MPRVQRSGGGISIQADLVEAGLDTGFALLHLAKTQSSRDARRALREAKAECRQGERRLAKLADADQRRLRTRFADLRHAIAGAGNRPSGAKILRMPASQ